MRTLVIGDVHGHVDRFKKLLEKAHPTSDDEIVQLGDLGHFGKDPRGDRDCYEIAAHSPIKFTVLWGNHDIAVMNKSHIFMGYTRPDNAMIELIRKVGPRYAYWAHNYLLTHAGLSPSYAKVTTQDSNIPQMLEEDASLFKDSVNAIGALRGGSALHGGILWRDERETLWNGVKQIFGHSRGGIREYNNNQSFCIDVGGFTDGNLVGIWLPDMKIVAVGEDADIFETQWKHLTEACQRGNGSRC